VAKRILSMACSRVTATWVAASLILIPLDAWSQEGERAPRIVAVISDEIPGVDAAALSGLEPGEQLTKATARRAIRTIWGSGRVSDVRVYAVPTAGGVIARIRLRLNQVLQSLEVEGNRAMSRRDVSRAMGFISGDRFEPERPGEMEASLRSAYSRRGYESASVGVEVIQSEDDTTTVDLVVRIDEGEPTRIESLAFEGRLGLDEAELRRALGFQAQDPFDQDDLVRAAQELLVLYRRRGYLQARVDAEGVVAERLADGGVAPTIPVDSGDEFEVAYVGNRFVDDDELDTVLALDQESELTPAVLDLLQARLVDHYRGLGFHFVRVERRIVPVATGRRRLVFRFRTGPQVEVRQIRFEGNVHFSDRYLRRQVVAELQAELERRAVFAAVSDDEVTDLGVAGEGSEHWRPGPRRHPGLRVDSSRTFVQGIYDQAFGHIQDLYEAEGFLSAEVGEPELSFTFGGRHLEVSVPVFEGQRTMIRDLGVQGAEGLGEPRVRRIVGLRPGDPLDRFGVEEARRRVLEAYRRRGYLFATVTTDERQSDDGLLAEVQYEVIEGDRVRIGAVLVRGNEVTRTSLIRDRVGFSSGDVYTPQLALRAESLLVDLGIFTTVSVSLVDAEEPGPVKNVIIDVVEKPQQLVDVFAGFSLADGPRLSMLYGYRNLWGYALGVELRGEVSWQVFFFGTPRYEEYVRDLDLLGRTEHLAAIGFDIPHLPGVGRWLRLRFDLLTERNLSPAYAVWRQAATVSLTFRLSRFLSFQAATGFEHLDVDQVSDLPPCENVDRGIAFCQDMTISISERERVCDWTCDTTFEVCGGGDTCPEGEGCRVWAPKFEEQDPGNNCLFTSAETIQNQRAPQGDSWLWVTRALLSLDLRDDPFNVSRGFYASASAEHVHSLRPIIDRSDPESPVDRSSDLVKVSLLMSGYIPLGLNRMVLALSARFGWVFPLTDSSTTYPDRFFYLGGFDSVRGFFQEAMTTQDVREPGGTSMLTLRGELRIPLVGALSVGLFCDAGNTWRLQENLWRDFDMRVTLGGGLRYRSPVGPIALDGGFVVRSHKQWEEVPGAVHFSIGLF